MKTNTINQSKQNFGGSYLKLIGSWENARTENVIDKPIQKIIDNAKDVVILSVSGKGRFHCVTDAIDATFENTPVIFTDAEALHYRFLTEKTNTKANEALNYIIRSSIEILSPDNKITRHQNLETLTSSIVIKKPNCKTGELSEYTETSNPNKPNDSYIEYVEPPQMPSEEAISKLKSYISSPSYKIKNFFSSLT